MQLLDYIKTWRTPYLLAGSLALIAIIGFLDYLTGYELVFSLFYILPIAAVTWGTSRRYGIAASFMSAFFLCLADLFAGNPYSTAIIVWNTVIRLGVFMIIVYLLSSLNMSHEREKELARTDPLTGAANSRHFHELLTAEINRGRRYNHPFTLVYLDLDNFKSLNDLLGHSVGDEVLGAIVHYARKNLRKTDAVGRLGGDEFAVLLPETDQPAARSVVSKLQRGLLGIMEERKWQITFSIGALTCHEFSCIPDQIIAAADRLMYNVKHAGKNSVVFQICREASEETGTIPLAQGRSQEALEII